MASNNVGHYEGDSADLELLVDLEKWIIKGFQDRGQEVHDVVGCRCVRWRGRLSGIIIELEDEA